MKPMKTKVVKYLGQKYKVANCAKFMATDYDGSIFWFAENPDFFNGFWIPVSNVYGEAIMQLTIKVEPFSSLKEI